MSFQKINKFLHCSIIGMILGDAYLYKPKNQTINKALIKVDHSIKQLELVKHKKELLKDFVNCEINTRSYNDGRNPNNLSCNFKTIYSEKIFFYYINFYKFINGKNIKVLPRWIRKYLINPITLAYWFMDNGYRNKSKALYLNTHRFSLKEVELIVFTLNAKLNLNCSIHEEPRKRGFKIYIPNNNYEFSNIVKPFLIESMYYKLPMENN